jgi:hypothetical protein
MNTNKNWLLAALVAGTLLHPSDPARAAITGQWDFKHGDLTATIGQNLTYADTVTQAGTKFGTTASFGIPGVAGVSTNVMMFPQTTIPGGGFAATVGAAANEGGNYVNQYTVIMDVLFPTNSSFLPRALFTSDFVTTDFMADQNNSIGFSGGAFEGNLTPNTWHRVAVTVDTMGTISKFIDGVQVGTDQATPGGLDGPYSIVTQMFLFDDQNTNSQPGYIASLQFQDTKLTKGLIGALGVPVATGILTGPPPNPYLISETPAENLEFPGRSVVPPNPQIQIVLSDGATTVNTNTLQLKFNGAVVSPSIVKTGAVTTVTYNVTNLLAPASLNTVGLTYKDSTGANSLGTQYSFYVISSYAGLPASAAGPASSASTNGFIFRMVQAPSEAVGVFLQDNYTRAEQQLDGTLLNTNGVAFTNEAVLGPNPDGSWFIDQYAAANEGASDVIAFGVNLTSLTALPNLTTVPPFPGIPGVNGSTLNFADETLTYLSLTAGTYVFGVDVGVDRVDSPPGADDGYELFCGANPRDQFSTLVGQFARTAGNFGFTQNTNQFTFIVPVTGIYPFRLVHWQNNLGSNLAWYSVDPATGQFVLINDPNDSRSIKAFRVSSIPREPYVAEVYPAPAAQGVAANSPITVVLGDDDLGLNTNSVKLIFNGAAVTPTIAKNGKLTTASYNPNATRATVTNTVELIYADNSTPAKSFTNNWAFTIVLQTSGGAQVTGQWDFKNGDLSATVGTPLAYLGGAAGDSATKTTFGTTGSGAFASIPGINGVPTTIINPGGAATTDNNYGLIMQPNMSPNGGGNLVNQYSIIMDFYYPGGSTTWFNCQNTNNTTDGSIFIQNGDIGQGSGGYTMLTPLASGSWHRIALSVDLAAGVIYKCADGVIQNVWAQTGLDLARRAWQQDVLLFADGDGDDKGQIYVSSVQVRNGAMTTNELVALGGPDAGKIPVPSITSPPPPVTGQWDFKNGDLSATIGTPLTYLGGTNGDSATKTTFGTTGAGSFASIPGINGVATTVVDPGGAATTDNNYGLIMQHNISPNGGGKLVNEYTIIMDFYYPGGTETWFNCQNTNNTTDGSIFIQNGDIGQGSGGYNMVSALAGNAWHRIALSVDLAGGVITKYADGVIQNVWTQTGLDLARRAWQPDVLLFADGDGDDKGQIYVSSVQVRSGAMTHAQLLALGGPSAGKIPIDLVAAALPTIASALTSPNVLTLSLPPSAAGYTLQSSPSLVTPVWTPVSGVVSNSVSITIPPGATMQFYRLAQ